MLRYKSVTITVFTRYLPNFRTITHGCRERKAVLRTFIAFCRRRGLYHHQEKIATGIDLKKKGKYIKEKSYKSCTISLLHIYESTLYIQMPNPVSLRSMNSRGIFERYCLPSAELPRYASIFVTGRTMNPPSAGLLAI